MENILSDVVILAGGLATRLRPATQTLPKALMQINNRPFIHHQLQLLKQKGIKKVVLCVGYLGEMIEAEVEDGRQFGLQVMYSYDGPALLGTAGAIKKALPLLGETFFVLYGDSYLLCEYDVIQHAFAASNKPALMTVFNNNNCWDSSNVEFYNQIILAYDKKNRTERMNFIDYGLGLFHRSAFTNVPEHQFYDLASLYQELLQDNKLMGYEVKQRFYEAGSFTGIKELEYHLITQGCHA